MTRRRCLLGPRLFQAVLVAFVVAQSVLALNACALPMTAVSMPYAATDMPAPCDLPNNICLASYLQADQIVDAGALSVAPSTGAVLSAPLPAPARFDAVVTASRLATPPSTAPPPRILLCRMLN